MKRLLNIFIAVFIIIYGVNFYVRVSRTGEGIIWFWLSEKLRSYDAPLLEITGLRPPRWSDQERLEILGHMTFSFESSNVAEKIIRDKRLTNQKLTQEDVKLIVASVEHAVSEASLVSDQSLRKVHPDLPKQFREKYQTGLSKIAQGLDKGEMEEFAEGVGLYGEFKNWGTEHMSTFSYSPK